MRSWPNVRVFDPSATPTLKGEAGTLIAAVEVARRAGQTDRAWGLLNRVNGLRCTTAERGAYWWFVAALHRQSGRGIDSDAAFNRSLRAAEHAGDAVGAVMASAGLAENMRIRGDLGSAWKRHEDLLRQFRKHEEPRGVSWALGGLGQISLMSGRLKPAWRAFQEAHRMAIAASDVRAEGWALRGLGTTMMSESSASALHFLNEALGRFEQANFSAGIAWVAKSIGDCHMSSGRVEKAVDSLRLARARFAALRDPRGEAYSLLSESSVLLIERAHGQGSELLFRSKNLFERQSVAAGARSSDELMRTVDGRSPSLRSVCRAVIPGWNNSCG